MEKLLNKFIELNEKLDSSKNELEKQKLNIELDNCKRQMVNTGIFTFEGFDSKASW